MLIGLDNLSSDSIGEFRYRRRNLICESKFSGYKIRDLICDRLNQKTILYLDSTMFLILFNTPSKQTKARVIAIRRNGDLFPPAIT